LDTKKDKILFKDISFTLQKGETLGIIGKNGKGKSTLLNTIAGELKALHGVTELHSSTTFGHFGQTNISHLNPDNTVMDEVYLSNNKLGEGTVRRICGGMMFSGDDAKKKVSLLSGGEKSRVMLGKILAKEVNVLFLDEPTNHLDMSSIEALTQAIKNFEGSSIIVTHSEELLRAVCDRLIIFSNGSADYFDGIYDEFLEKIGWEDEDEGPKKKSKPKINKKESKRLRALVVQEKSKIATPIKKEISALEKKIISIEALVDTKKEELADFTNKGDNSKVMELSKEIALLEKEAETKFESLEISQTKLDSINDEYQIKLEELM
jgi:ATP-binding cassette subfamily F protein 3